MTFRAINVLASHGDVSLLDKISPFEYSEEETVRRSVVMAYGILKDENSRSRIIPFLDDQAYVVRAGAVKALMDLDDPENLKVIMKGMEIWTESGGDYFKYEYDVACLEAIGKFGNDKHLPMLRDVALVHKNDDCRASAVQALNALKDESLLEISIKMLSDEGYSYIYNLPVSHVAAKILHEINTEKAKVAIDNWLSGLDDDEKPDFV